MILVFILFFAGCPNDDIREADGVQRAEGLPQYDEKMRDEKIYWNGTIEDDFDDSSLVVIIDNFTGGVNKKHEDRFFGDFKKEYIRDLTIITDYFETIDEKLFRQIYEIKLPKESAGKEQVLSAIRKLEKIEGILYAGPNYYRYPVKAPDDWWYGFGYQWGLNGIHNYGRQLSPHVHSSHLIPKFYHIIA